MLLRRFEGALDAIRSVQIVQSLDVSFRGVHGLERLRRVSCKKVTDCLEMSERALLSTRASC